jgi:hypothetical protein
MRVLVKAQIPVEAGNRAIKDGSLPKALQSFIEQHHPEAAYFYPEHGKRTALFVLELSSESELVTMSEPLFTGAGADLEVTPVMNADDLQAGLGQIAGGG